MARKVVIGDLVVKVGVDSKDTARQLRGLNKQLTQSQKKQNTETRKGTQLEERRVKAAEVYLARSREFHKLKKQDYAYAQKAEAGLLDAAKKGDKIQAAVWKRRIGEQLELKRNDERAAANRIKALKKEEAARRRSEEAESKRKQRERQAEIRHQMKVQRAITTRNRMIRRGVGGISGFTSGALLSGGVAAGGAAGLVGAAALGGVNVAKDYRVGEQLLMASYSERGTTAEQAEQSREKLYKQSMYYNLDPAMMFQQMGQMMMNMPEISTDSIERMVMGMGILGSSMGIGNVDIARSMKGLQQFTVSQTAENLNQMTEAMPVLLSSVAKALNVSVAELQAAKKEGTLSDLMEAIGGKEIFAARMAQSSILKGTGLYEQNIDKLPNTLKTLSTNMSQMARLFGTSSESGVISFVNNLAKTLRDNEAFFVAAGEWTGYFFETVSESFSEMMDWLQPLIDEWLVGWDKLTDEEKAARVKETVGTIADTLEMLFYAFATAKVMSFAVGVASVVESLKKLFGLTALASAAGGATPSTGGGKLGGLRGAGAGASMLGLPGAMVGGAIVLAPLHADAMGKLQNAGMDMNSVAAQQMGLPVADFSFLTDWFGGNSTMPNMANMAAGRAAVIINNDFTNSTVLDRDALVNDIEESVQSASTLAQTPD